MTVTLIITAAAVLLAASLGCFAWALIDAGQERNWDAPPGRHRGPVKHAGRPPVAAPALLALPAGPAAGWPLPEDELDQLARAFEAALNGPTIVLPDDPHETGTVMAAAVAARYEPQPYCARPRCADRHAHWTGQHPEPGPVAAALAAERERATRLPDYALDEMGGHLTVDSLLDSIIGHVFPPATEAVSADG